jgi:hypothetical protein
MDLREMPQGGTGARHPWEVSRLRFFTRILEEHGKLSNVHRALDAGAGDGWFSSELTRHLPSDATITCWDAHYTAEQLARFGRGPVGRQTFTTELPSGPYDLLLLLDVLEHVQDDDAFLARLVDLLNAGAVALISVPAWQALYTEHDRRLRHHRRYSPARAERVLRGAGLVVESRGGLFHSLLLARGWEWLREKIRPAAESEHIGASRHGPLVSAAAEGILTVDNGLSHFCERHGVDLPGLSWWALCRKP